MRTINRVCVGLLVVITVSKCLCCGVAASFEAYNVYNQLQNALVDDNSTSGVPNLHVLADVFFPKGGLEPVCVPIKYILLCDQSSELDVAQQNYSFLWTENYISFSTGVLLLSYSKSGITLRGFEWESSCVFMNETELILEVSSLSCSNSVLVDSLKDLTSQLKAFADAQSIPSVSSKYRGHALKWNNSGQEVNRYEIIFIIHIVVLNIFIFCCSIVSSNTLYQKLYKNIAGKTNPGYSFFWAIVILSVVWNVAPSWLVLSKYDNKVYCSLAIVIPLQLLVALLVKKKCKFPIPGMKAPSHSVNCVGDVHSLTKSLFASSRCLFSHIIQVLALWSLLITFTFFMHYLTSIILSLYIDPLNSLVKIVFVKAVIVSFIIAVALIFAVDVISCKCTTGALMQNIGSILSVLTIVSLLPLIFFLVFMIGGIIFNGLPQSSSWKAIFTLIPSAALLYASWFSRGSLFPKGLTDPGDATKEIVHDLEGNTAPPNPAHTQVTMNEATPLLPRPQNDDGMRSRVTASLESSSGKNA